MRTIVVGTDTSAAADLAVEDAARLARDRGAELVVLYVKAEGDDRVGRRPGPCGGSVRRTSGSSPRGSRACRRRPGSRTATPPAGSCDVAEEVRADTIVLGNRGMHGSRWRVRESVPNLVLRHAPCSVYIVDTRKAQ